jgi:Fe-S cluster assembly scaffold protein SufB
MEPPDWAHLRMAPIDFQALSYYSAPKSMKNAPKSLDEVDPKLLETYEKLGVPLHERARLAGVAVDAVFDSVSVGTTFRKQLADVGVIFCSFSHAVQHHPELDRALPGHRGAAGRQLLRRAQLGGVLRRLLRLHPQGVRARWSCRRTSASTRRTPGSSSAR